MSKSTCEVGKLLWSANYFLKTSAPEKIAERKLYASIIGGILHATGNYQGFMYLEQSSTRNLETNETVYAFGDETRVFYHIAAKIYDAYDKAKKDFEDSGISAS